WKYDPAEAKQLLAQSGYPNGFSTTLFSGEGRVPGFDAAQMCQTVAGYLAKVGIKADIQVLQPQAFVAAVSGHKFNGLVLYPVPGGADPAFNFRNYVHGKGTVTSSYYPELDLDTLLDQADAAFEIDKRRALVEQIVTKHYEAAGYLFMYEAV